MKGSTMLQELYSQEKCLLSRRLDGLQSQCGYFGEEINLLPLLGIKL